MTNALLLSQNNVQKEPPPKSKIFTPSSFKAYLPLLTTSRAPNHLNVINMLQNVEAFFSGRRTDISEKDLGDLHGKVVIITGGNSGIGFTTIQFLARKGAKVYMASRNEQTSKAAIERLKEEGIEDGSVHWLKLDLADPRNAKAAAQEFMEKENRLDILINNAAKGYPPFNLTKDGLRESMVTNYLSHYVLTENLVALMIRTSKEEGSDVRIINLTSAGHSRVAPSSFKGKDNFNVDYGDTTSEKLNTYCLSKVANILHINHLQERLNQAKADIICIAVDPGIIATENVAGWIERMSWFLGTAIGLLVWLLFTTPRQGAMNTVFAAASPEVKAKAETFKGVHLRPVGQIVKASPQARDARLGQELYETTLDILKEMYL